MDGQGQIDLELELPRGEHRERLLDALGNLVRRRGFETLVSAPILLPRSAYFPEKWERNVTGARRLLRRLMHYAELGELEVRLESFRARPVMPSAMVPWHTGNHVAAWFAGLRQGICEFGLELDQLRHEESLVATLGHEVAHAYRDHHGLVIRDRDLEEKLTDLTCVYLGFGAFVLNASHVVTTGGFSAAGEALAYETRSLGYLSSAEFALLLSAQLALRGDDAEQRAVRRELLPNHAALVESGLREFGDGLGELRRRLSVPERAAWPPRRDLGELAALPNDEVPDDEVPPDAEPSGAATRPERETPRSEGAIAFRVKQTRAALTGTLGFGSAGVAGAALGAESYALLGVCVLGAVAGVAAGRRLRVDECSGAGPTSRSTPNNAGAAARAWSRRSRTTSNASTPRSAIARSTATRSPTTVRTRTPSQWSSPRCSRPGA